MRALGHAANFAQMTWGDQQDPPAAAVLNTCFIPQAEHGLNASTFVARVTASTNADMHAAATAALGALKGPLHGGATDGTMKMLDEIGTPEHVEAWVQKAIRLVAKMPTILAAYIRRRRGEQPIPPEASLGHAANFAHMTWGDKAHRRAAEILNAAMIIQAEHGMNASTFAARITAATNADMHAAVTSAFGALKGPLHGGATDGTMRMLDEIASPDHVETWVDKAIERKYLFSGFGHRVYRTEDPRAKHLRRFASELAKEWTGPRYFDIQERLVKAIAERRPKMSPGAAAKVHVVNVDFYAATTYTFVGIPADLGTSIFALGRIAGWCAHIMEQHGDNRLIRPESEYTGPTGKRWVPIQER